MSEIQIPPPIKTELVPLPPGQPIKAPVVKTPAVKSPVTKSPVTKELDIQLPPPIKTESVPLPPGPPIKSPIKAEMKNPLLKKTDVPLSLGSPKILASDSRMEEPVG